jgi:hypothetical protein
MTTSPAEEVAVLSKAAGLRLDEDRCAELAPLFLAVRESAERLQSVDLGDHEPPGSAA